MRDETLAITLTLTGAPPQPGEARVTHWSWADRAQRALKALGLCWAAALGCVFIPLAHFILVPTLLLVGLVLFVSKLRARVTLASIEASCPRCLTPRTYEESGRFQDGRGVHCDGCGSTLTLSVAAPPRA